jgi:hypothetical protein
MTGGRIILPPTNPSLDANGDPVSGSTLTFYQNGTTSLVSIYSNKALTVPLANPLTSDSAGVFPQVWVSNSAGYSVKWSRTGLADVTFDDIYPDLDSSATGNYLVVGQSQAVLGDNITTAFGTLGVGLIENAFTQTDSTTGAGTVATAYASVFGAVTFATPANAITITNAYGLYLKEPIAGAHVTLTKKYALGVDSLKVGNNPSTLDVPTRQKLTSGSGATYTTPANCRQLRVRILGAGGGGASKASTASNGSAGVTSSFHGITAIAGSGGNSNGNAGAGGTGGSDTPTSGSVVGLVRVDGNGGGQGANATASTSANGGFGGAGGIGGGTTNSNSAKANSGAGGSGQGVSSSAEFSGGGGGGGETVEFFINTPAATYLYTIGGGGSGGTGGGNGGSAQIVVDEYY